MNKKQTILIITFCIPWPVADGGKMYVYTSVNYLRRHYDITLLFSVYSQTDLDNVVHIQSIWPDVKIEVVSYIKQLGFKEKVKKGIRDFYTKNISKNAIGEQEHIFFNLRKKITNIFLLSPNFLSKCEQLFAQNTFDIVQVEYSTNIAAINFIPEKTITVYVEIESLYSIMEDFMTINGGGNFSNAYLVNCAKNIELDFLRRYDAIFTLNVSDNERIGKHLPVSTIYTSPYAVPDNYFSQPDIRQNWRPEKIIFVGSESHYPNKDAVEWYIKEILPLVKKSNLKLYITGIWSEAFKKPLSGNSNIAFTGFVNDLSALMTNSIMIVPIRLGGGGIRAKIIQAMAFGIPVVATSLGCAGIVANNDERILMRNDPQSFADAVSLLSTNIEKGKALLEASFKTANENYAEAAAGEVRHGFYQQLLREKLLNSSTIL
jgi:glycosyltransferase involved in cell wall biosynthesis